MRPIFPVLASAIVLATPAGRAPTLTAAPAAGTTTTVTHLAKGSFDVKVTPITLTDPVETGGFPRLAIAKTFHGDLTGTSVGQMIANSDANQTTGGYVALELVTGTLQGKQGTFALMHNGTMTPTSMEMRIMVVPGSGTGDLTGIAGTFRIIIEGKKHLWEFEYTLP